MKHWAKNNKDKDKIIKIVNFRYSESHLKTQEINEIKLVLNNISEIIILCFILDYWKAQHSESRGVNLIGPMNSGSRMNFWYKTV